MVKAQDILIAFEMYCKEDYEKEFIMTKKQDIDGKQFKNLFVTCLKSDSFKIAMVIYLLYLDVKRDMNTKMLDLILQQMKESEKYHEIKLFFIHEHFDDLSIKQMNVLVDNYLAILFSKNTKHHPIVNAFNTVKLTLLIYKICWKIEQKQIYSLITKCRLLQDYLIQSLEKYMVKQNNILILQRLI